MATIINSLNIKPIMKKRKKKTTINCRHELLAEQKIQKQEQWLVGKYYKRVGEHHIVEAKKRGTHKGKNRGGRRKKNNNLEERNEGNIMWKRKPEDFHFFYFSAATQQKGIKVKRSKPKRPSALSCLQWLGDVSYPMPINVFLFFSFLSFFIFLIFS